MGLARPPPLPRGPGSALGRWAPASGRPAYALLPRPRAPQAPPPQRVGCQTGPLAAARREPESALSGGAAGGLEAPGARAECRRGRDAGRDPRTSPSRGGGGGDVTTKGEGQGRGGASGSGRDARAAPALGSCRSRRPGRRPGRVDVASRPEPAAGGVEQWRGWGVWALCVLPHAPV